MDEHPSHHRGRQRRQQLRDQTPPQPPTGGGQREQRERDGGWGGAQRCLETPETPECADAVDKFSLAADEFGLWCDEILTLWNQQRPTEAEDSSGSGAKERRFCEQLVPLKEHLSELKGNMLVAQRLETDIYGMVAGRPRHDAVRRSREGRRFSHAENTKSHVLTFYDRLYDKLQNFDRSPSAYVLLFPMCLFFTVAVDAASGVSWKAWWLYAPYYTSLCMLASLLAFWATVYGEFFESRGVRLVWAGAHRGWQIGLPAFHILFSGVLCWRAFVLAEDVYGMFGSFAVLVFSAVYFVPRALMSLAFNMASSSPEVRFHLRAFRLFLVFTAISNLTTFRKCYRSSCHDREQEEDTLAFYPLAVVYDVLIILSFCAAPFRQSATDRSDRSGEPWTPEPPESDDALYTSMVGRRESLVRDLQDARHVLQRVSTGLHSVVGLIQRLQRRGEESAEDGFHRLSNSSRSATSSTEDIESLTRTPFLPLLLGDGYVAHTATDAEIELDQLSVLAHNLGILSGVVDIMGEVAEDLFRICRQGSDNYAQKLRWRMGAGRSTRRLRRQMDRIEVSPIRTGYQSLFMLMLLLAAATDSVTGVGFEQDYLYPLFLTSMCMVLAAQAFFTSHNDQPGGIGIYLIIGVHCAFSIVLLGLGVPILQKHYNVFGTVVGVILHALYYAYRARTCVKLTVLSAHAATANAKRTRLHRWAFVGFLGATIAGNVISIVNWQGRDNNSDKNDKFVTEVLSFYSVAILYETVSIASLQAYCLCGCCRTDEDVREQQPQQQQQELVGSSAQATENMN